LVSRLFLDQSNGGLQRSEDEETRLIDFFEEGSADWSPDELIEVPLGLGLAGASARGLPSLVSERAGGHWTRAP
jgi:hypothetical protein